MKEAVADSGLFFHFFFALVLVSSRFFSLSFSLFSFCFIVVVFFFDFTSFFLV